MKSVKNKKFDPINIIISLLYVVLSLILLIFNEKALSNYNYILVIIFTLIGVIKLINNKNINDIIIGILSVWSALFIYIYYYQTIMILFLPVCFSLYSLIIGLISLKEKNKIITIISLLISILLIIKPIIDVIIYIKIFAIYIIIINIYYYLKNK